MDREEERDKRISDFLDWDEDKELTEDAMKVIVRLAEKDPMNCTVMLTKIHTIVSHALTAVKKEANANWNATERAIQMLDMPKNCTCEDWVIQTTPIVMTLFPGARANVHWASQLTKEFFEKWITALKKCPTFFIESDWARREGYTKYFNEALKLDSEKNDKSEQPL